jgi:hypothetical protein
MQFQLPSNLQNEIIAYDPILKKLEQVNKKSSNSPTKKPKFPIGNPPVLIPSDVIKSTDLQQAVEHINSRIASERCHEFRRAQGEFPEQEYKTFAVIYHWEGLWVAAWLPPAGKEDEYVYGYTYCYKDSASIKKMMPYEIATDSSFLREDVGRSSYMIKTVFVTKQDIINGYVERKWLRCDTYSKKWYHYIGPAVKRFEADLRRSLPCWDDGTISMFDRLREGSIPFRTIFPYYESDKDVYEQYFGKCTELYNLTQENWVLTVDTLFTFVDYVTTVSAGYRYDSLLEIRRVRHVLDKPFFRKWIQGQCEEINKAFKDPTNRSKKAVTGPFRKIVALSKSIYTVIEVWPNCPIDYIQSNIYVLIGTRSNAGMSAETKLWLRDNMPVASYFNVLTKFYSERIGNNSTSEYYYDKELRCYQFPFSEWDDTISMMNKILSAGNFIEAPKRWRLTEFHDHVQAEAWKISNPNESLPQDLFPSPVKVHLEDKTWSFFQPIDTHQLSQWGRAVRNCVGNAGTYAEGVKKKQHFIVLCMIDGVPTFTVQLTVRMGLMNVEQIVSVSNKRLSSEQDNAYTKAFSLALQAQEERLKSGATAS